MPTFCHKHFLPLVDGGTLHTFLPYNGVACNNARDSGDALVRRVYHIVTTYAFALLPSTLPHLLAVRFYTGPDRRRVYRCGAPAKRIYGLNTRHETCTHFERRFLPMPLFTVL